MLSESCPGPCPGHFLLACQGHIPPSRERPTPFDCHLFGIVSSVKIYSSSADSKSGVGCQEPGTAMHESQLESMAYYSILQELLFGEGIIVTSLPPNDAWEVGGPLRTEYPGEYQTSGWFQNLPAVIFQNDDNHRLAARGRKGSHLLRGSIDCT